MPLSRWAYKLLYEGRCSKCRFNRAAPKRSWCRECSTAYMREWRRKDPEARRRNYARVQANFAQRYELIKPEPCEDCGSLEVVKHHPDYSNPLVVAWLCKPCHRARHRFLDSLRAAARR